MTNNNQPTEINQSAILLRNLYDDQNPQLIAFKQQLFTEIKRFINLFVGERLKIYSDIVSSTSFETMATVIMNYYNEDLIEESKLTRIFFDRSLLLLISKIAQQLNIAYYNWLFPTLPEIKTEKYVVTLRSIDSKMEELFRNERTHMKTNLKLANPIQTIDVQFNKSCYNLVNDLQLTICVEIKYLSYNEASEMKKIREYVHSALIYNGILHPIDDISVIVV